MLLNTKCQSRDFVVNKDSITKIIKKNHSKYSFLEKGKW